MFSVNNLVYIPSPSFSSINLGFVKIHIYALTMITAIVVAVILSTKRYVQKGGLSDVMVDIALWSIPFGIIGARLYHVLSSPSDYFGSWNAFSNSVKIWHGGLSIWGAVLFGAVGAWVGAKRAGVSLGPVADAIAPVLPIAQAIGRIGNWFNQELFGIPTTMPWGLKVSSKVAENYGYTPTTLFQPTFLYEIIWNICLAFVLLFLDKRCKLGFGRLFCLYIAGYCLGRTWIEALRMDDAIHFFNIRLNDIVSVVVFIFAVIAFLVIGRIHKTEVIEGFLDNIETTNEYHFVITDNMPKPKGIKIDKKFEKSLSPSFQKVFNIPKTNLESKNEKESSKPSVFQVTQEVNVRRRKSKNTISNSESIKEPISISPKLVELKKSAELTKPVASVKPPKPAQPPKPTKEQLEQKRIQDIIAQINSEVLEEINNPKKIVENKKELPKIQKNSNSIEKEIPQKIVRRSDLHRSAQYNFNENQQQLNIKHSATTQAPPVTPATTAPTTKTTPQQPRQQQTAPATTTEHAISNHKITSRHTRNLEERLELFLSGMDNLEIKETLNSNKISTVIQKPNEIQKSNKIEKFSVAESKPKEPKVLRRRDLHA